jgi:hypothetical protein
MNAAEPVADRVSQQEIQRQIDVIERLHERGPFRNRNVAGDPTAQHPRATVWSPQAWPALLADPQESVTTAESTGRE